jgi:hypothetical protein
MSSKVSVVKHLMHFQSISSSILVLQPCVDLELLHGFIRVYLCGVGSLAPCPLEDQDYTSSGSYPLTCLAWMALPQ